MARSSLVRRRGFSVSNMSRLDLKFDLSHSWKGSVVQWENVGVFNIVSSTFPRNTLRRKVFEVLQTPEPYWSLPIHLWSYTEVGVPPVTSGVDVCYSKLIPVWVESILTKKFFSRSGWTYSREVSFDPSDSCLSKLLTLRSCVVYVYLGIAKYYYDSFNCPFLEDSGILLRSLSWELFSKNSVRLLMYFCFTIV